MLLKKDLKAPIIFKNIFILDVFIGLRLIKISKIKNASMMKVIKIEKIAKYKSIFST